MTRTTIIAAAVLSIAMLAAACSGGRDAGSGVATNWSRVTSLAQGGGMTALIAAARKEGQLNVFGLPSDRANYGTIMKDFTAKYGIRINDVNPAGSSRQEFNALTRPNSRTRAPDVLDMTTAFAIRAARMKLLARYEVTEWYDIPAAEKSAAGTWYGDYGGYIAIGYDSKTVKVPPASIKDLAKPIYKHKVGIHGNPTQTSAAFSAVYAAALANGGSLSNIRPGIAFFAHLKKIGNYVPLTAGPASVRSGRTPIVIWWDYLLASKIAATDPRFKIVIPSDASYEAYDDQAINADAPHPAAARLWEEYLYSAAGQNLWLQGTIRPVELPTMIANGTVDRAAAAMLPPAPSTPLSFPTPAQLSAAGTVVARRWRSKVGRLPGARGRRSWPRAAE
jgi:putative spermidine/putrescine transport system substrate-binding protein